MPGRAVHGRRGDRRLWGAVLLVVLSACSAGSTARPDPFRFLHTVRTDREAFLAQFSACQRENAAFNALLDSIRRDGPLNIEVSESGDVLFGSSYRQKTFIPHLHIDLDDLGRLPDAAAVTRWAVDSNWAWTRCEVLGHEVAEGIRYRRLWSDDSSGGRLASGDTGFTTRARAAHLYGLVVAGSIAASQRTRRDASAFGYSRASFCSWDGVINLIFGQSTETIVLRGDGDIRSIVFLPGANRCADSTWRRSADSIQKALRG